MKTDNKLEILPFYRSNEGREALFCDISSNIDSMEESDYHIPEFWNSGGGFEICLNGYCTILHTNGFYNLYKATNFLLHSLYWLSSSESSYFPIDDEFPEDVVVRTMNFEIIRIKNSSTGYISISFVPTAKSTIRKRGDKYFTEVVIEENAWVGACKIALDEYFQILKMVISDSDSNEYKKAADKYLEIWSDIK